jgi:hypothetical protein
MVNALSKTALEHLGLETTLQEIFDFQGKHVIETQTRLVEHTNAHKSTNEGIAFEKTLRILLIKLKQFTSGTTDLGQNEGDAPDLALVAKAVLASELCPSVSFTTNIGNRRTLSSASKRADSKGRRGTL